MKTLLFKILFGIAFMFCLSVSCMMMIFTGEWHEPLDILGSIYNKIETFHK